MRGAAPSRREEGYVKYIADHRTAPAVEPPLWRELNEARTCLYDRGLIGALPNGIGFGNVSVRVTGEEFLISGTATGDCRVLTAHEYCVVTSFNLEENRVTTSGPVRASSESMSHGAVYRSRASVMCVIHVHSRKIFDRLLSGGCISTPPEAAYGSPEMALAISTLAAAGRENRGVIVLAGHDEGVLSYGVSVREALNLILELDAPCTP
ncbi:MAG: class II aldolase/adducin family protein [Spirochaetaceae bacterium]|jgi:ribulose-5-phosphate 4-epimerase/fuculose-1-phosphate aldolase|nr:class II aldolase/adducin family protein [Spirochaetaceae bacterium]